MTAKKKILAAFLTASVCAVGLGVAKLHSDAQSANIAEQVTFVMEEGAAARYNLNLSETERYAYGGLRFFANISAADLQKLQNAYSALSFGVFIAPYEYVQETPFTVENLFGEQAKYYWTEDNSPATGSALQSGKAQIVHHKTALKADGENYLARGSLVDILTENIDREFIGLAYFSYNLDGVTKYRLAEYAGDKAENNARSIAYVAQLAQDGDETKEVKDWLNEYYISLVTDKTERYTVEHYVETYGGYELKELETVTTATIDDLVTVTPKNYDGFVFDSGNAKNALSGKVYANGRLTLKAYYSAVESSEADLGLIDKKTVPYIDLTGVGTSRTLFYANGGSVDADISGDTLATENLNGAYVLTGLNGNVKTVTYFDVYSADEAAPEWNNSLTIDGARLQPTSGDELIKTHVSLTTEIPSGGTANTQYYKVTGESERYAFSLAPIHSKAYYERYKDQAFALSFEYYLQAESKDSGVTVKSAFTATPETVVWDESDVEKWHTATIALESLLENWDGGQLTVRDFSRLALLDGVAYTGGVLAGASAVKESVAYFGNYSFKSNLSKVDTITVEDTLLDVKDKTAFDLSSLVPEEDEGYFGRIAAMSDDGVTWTMQPVHGSGAAVTLDSEVVTVSTLQTGYYTVCGNVSQDGNYYPLFQANVDFYNSETPLEWNDVLAEYFTFETLSGGAATVTSSVVNSAAGRTGAYMSMAIESEVTTTLLPKHSKAYYESVVPQTDSLYFDYYIENPTAINGDLTTVYFANKYDGSFGQYHVQRKLNTWLTEYVPIKDFVLTYWDEGIVSGKATAAARNGFIGFHKYVAASTGSSVTAENMVAYVGNFRILPASLGGTTQAETVLLDVTKSSSCKLNELLNETQKSYTNYGAIEWSLTPAYGGEKTVVNGAQNILELASIEKRAYLAEAALVRDGATLATLYKGVVDIYASTDPIVWNNIASVSDIWSRIQTGAWSVRADESSMEGAEFAEIVTLTETGHTGNYYKISALTDGDGNAIKHTFGAYVLPIHSKAYYELYKDYTLSFEIYAVLNRNAYVMGKNFTTFTSKEWKTFTLSVSDVVTTYWNYILGTSSAAGYNAQYCPMLSVTLDSAGYDFYIGGFAFEKASGVES